VSIDTSPPANLVGWRLDPSSRSASRILTIKWAGDLELACLRLKRYL
jgi:hypothetical protein